MLQFCSVDKSIQEMTKVLNIEKDSILQVASTLTKDQSVTIAANIFDANLSRIKSSFSKLMNKTYGFIPQQLKSAEQVNNWCAKNTNNKIKKLVDDIKDIETILLSAIHFKADWKQKFDKSNTKAKPFYGFEKNSTVDMMFTDSKMQYAKTDSAQIAHLEYANSSLKAVIILPHGNSK